MLYEYKAELVSVYDADTMRFDIDLGFYIWIKDQSVRLSGIDAWEIRGAEREKGVAARNAVMRIFAERGSSCQLRTHKSGSREKYGRWLAEVILSGGLNLNDWLLVNGHARPYV